MTANDRQPGGSHYQSPYQHWDFVRDAGLGYLTGCATKYLARFKLKNGVADLEKAAHYIEKRLEIARRATEARRARTASQRDAINRFVLVNCKDDELQSEVIARVTFFRTIEDLSLAAERVSDLLERERKLAASANSGEATGAYVNQASGETRPPSQ